MLGVFGRRTIGATVHSPGESLLVVINVFKDPLETLNTCVTTLRYHNPRAAIVVIADGDDRHDMLSQIVYRVGGLYVPDEQLMLMQYGGAWTQRTLDLWRMWPLDILVKADPDTVFHRPFKPFPEAEAFGSIIEPESGCPVPHGCCRFYRAPLIQRMLDKQVFWSPTFVNDKTLIYCRKEKRAWRGKNDTRRFVDPVINDDRLNGRVLRRLRVTPAQYDDVCRRFRDNRDLKYAVTHGDKE